MPLRVLRLLIAVCCCLALAGCGGGGGGDTGRAIIVNSAADPDSPPAGVVTLRSAIAEAQPGDAIVFAPGLDGAVIQLTQVGEAHSVLLGEAYSGMTYLGYQERDYGRSALYARKDLWLDASTLARGVTIHWAGGDANPARVLAVYGNLTMQGVTLSGGRSVAETTNSADQPYTLARGGGLAVWGPARLTRCTVADNRCAGDAGASRDRGAYGGGIYADGLEMTDCVISGNTASGYGAAGGGVYSVGGAANATGRGNDAVLSRCTISGNRVTAQHAYGGGVFTLSGGPTNLATMYLTNCTIARNLVEDNPDLPQAGQYYYRGGGLYMGGGSLAAISCTIAENEVNGTPATFSGKPNMGGGGVAATVGNAHTVETVWVQHSIVVGNRMNGEPADWFAGSLLDFVSLGYNRFGALDFSQILAPVPDWMMLSRKHYPKIGDQDGVAAAAALDLAGAQLCATVTSAGTDAGRPALLWYAPGAASVDQAPAHRVTVPVVSAGYTGFGEPTDDFLNHALARIRTQYSATLGDGFGAGFGDKTGVTWYGPRVTWPSNPQNAAWIAFWRDVDAEIGGRLGSAGLNDDFWGSFVTGPLGERLAMTVSTTTHTVDLTSSDQLGVRRPRGSAGDIGAIER